MVTAAGFALTGLFSIVSVVYIFLSLVLFVCLFLRSASKLCLFVQRGKNNVSQAKHQVIRQWESNGENSILGLRQPRYNSLFCEKCSILWTWANHLKLYSENRLWCQRLLLKSKIMILKILLLSNCRATWIFLAPLNSVSSVPKSPTIPLLSKLIYIVLNIEINNLWARWWVEDWFCSLMVTVFIWGCKATLILASLVMGLVFTQIRTVSIANIILSHQ